MKILKIFLSFDDYLIVKFVTICIVVYFYIGLLSHNMHFTCEASWLENRSHPKSKLNSIRKLFSYYVQYKSFQPPKNLAFSNTGELDQSIDYT